jgi:dTDP-glucose 4,6-dehydratase
MIPLFVTNLIDGIRIPLYGDGLNVRDWLHVEDHCRGISAVIERGKAGEVYNIGGGTELTNIEVTRMILELCNKDMIVGIQWIGLKAGSNWAIRLFIHLPMPFRR